MCDSRNLIDIAANLVLGLDTGVVGICALLRSSRSARAPETHVLVVSNGLFGESAKDLVLLVAEALYPALHVVEHLTLDLGVAVVEFRMESVYTWPLGQ